jgi:hypothetical protein
LLNWLNLLNPLNLLNLCHSLPLYAQLYRGGVTD